MSTNEHDIELLENIISEIQKEIAIKREVLKIELQNDDEKSVEELQDEIKMLKEKVLWYQGELRKRYLKKGNIKIATQESDKKKQSVDL